MSRLARVWGWRPRLRGWRQWPSPPPTVPMGERPRFHCPACKEPVEDREKVCSRCGRPLR